MIRNVEEFILHCIDGEHYTFGVLADDGKTYTHPRCIFTKDIDKCYSVSDNLVRNNCEIETNQWLILDLPKTWRANVNN